MRVLLSCGFLAALVIGAAGCGYSESEWQAQLDKYNHLKSDDDAKVSEACLLYTSCLRAKVPCAPWRCSLRRSDAIG